MSEGWRDIAIGHIAYWVNHPDEPLELDCLADWVNKKCYPFGPRRFTPYRIWLEEIRLLRVFLTTGKSLDCYQPWRKQFTSKRERRGQVSTTMPSPGQLTLFEED
jgi:hypothetical protein